MKCRLSMPALAVVAALAAPLSCSAAPSHSLPPEAAKVATDFVAAFVKNDRDAISRMLPTDPANLYGPSPFARMPVFSKPRAEERSGAINFEGGRSEPGLPDKGVIVLRKMEEKGRTMWRVRQIYWYDKLPPEARQIPDKSKTEADRRQEPAIRSAALEFVHNWMARNYSELDRNVFHWWQVDRRPPSWVKLTGVDLGRPVNSLGGLRIGFTVNLRFLRAIPKSVEGNLWLVQENGAWRVRPLTVAFWF